MNIAVNGKSFSVAQKGGALRVALSVVEKVAVCRPDFTLHVFVPTWPGRSLSTPELPQNVRLHTSDSRLFRYGLFRSVWEQLILPFLVRGLHNCAALLNLTNSAPMLASPGVNQILLVHDPGFLN